MELAEQGRLDYLIFECLAERTIALAQQAKLRDPERGYDPHLEERVRAVLPICIRNGTRIVTNAGAANPAQAARVVQQIARSMGLHGIKIAAVLGDDVLDIVRRDDPPLLESGNPCNSVGDRIISANAYIGVEPIVEALEHDADLVITGRCADPSLFLAPMMHHFQWGPADWTRLGAGTIAGHLLECAGQVSGGYFADPGLKDVPNLARLGFPLAEVTTDGSAIITKVDGSGGEVSEASCKEQLLYEIHDPGAYLTPDVTADFTEVTVRQLGKDRVAVEGGRGRPRPPSLKVSIGCREGFAGEGQISYAGRGAAARARLALDIVRERLRLTEVPCRDLRFDLIGVNSLHGDSLAASWDEPYEVRARAAGRADSREAAARIGAEVEALYTNGPAGGGGARQEVSEVIGIWSALVAREAVSCRVEYFES
jgi:hypothetical protein